jgi:sigma-B regulation protein RsbU (phosphoserine phosphatase)
LFTDGITEAVNLRKEEFGDSLLLDTLLNNRTSTTTDLVSSLFSAVDSFAQGEAQADDITCVAIRRRETRASTGLKVEPTVGLS